ncbi:hypothetical protein CK203_029568 [Vitis vinifera]|uniref:Uncharacterized protein n=1 Tax=Vitis vinifera TaxID=29760 RepID=A0A438JCI0_VITVI|nr:hypothetical protein CK203_029568 [Vitis vinifera]
MGHIDQWLRRATGEMEPKDGMRDGGREEERGLGENTWPTYLLMGSGHPLQDKRGMWGIFWTLTPNGEDGGVAADDKGRTLAAAKEGEGESQTREGKRVMEEEGGSRLETQTQVVDGMWRLTARAGATHGLSSRVGWVAPRASGYGAYARPRIWKPKEGVGLVAEGPSVETSLHSNVAQICGPSSSRIPAPEDPLLREKDDMRRLSGAELIQNERSPTDFALVEER